MFDGGLSFSVLHAAYVAVCYCTCIVICCSKFCLTYFDVPPDEVRSVLVYDGRHQAALYALVEEEGTGAWQLSVVIDRHGHVTETQSTRH